MELSKDEFLNILIEGTVLIDRGGAAAASSSLEESKNPADMKKKFTKQTILLGLSKTCGFDGETLTYVDFLEALMRVAQIYPFSEQDKDKYVRTEAKIGFVIKKLEDHYSKVVDEFVEKSQKRNQEMKYKLKPVILEDDA